MKNRIPILAILVGAAAFAAQAQQRHVVVISLDGFPASILRDPSLPFTNLRRMAREGVGAEGMIPVNPTVTWPNHTAMITGVGPGRHGVFYNGQLVRGGEGKSPRWSPGWTRRNWCSCPPWPMPRGRPA